MLERIAVRVTKPELISLFGKETSMTFEQANHYKRLGFIEFIDEKERQRIKKLYSSETLRWTKGTRIAWVEDQPRHVLGGAELSNKRIKEVGRELGFDIVTVTQHNFNYDILCTCDLIILNNLFCFHSTLMQLLREVIWELRKPYVKYDHDHRELMHYERRAFSIPLFHNSRLNIFISPFHFRNFLSCMGEGIKPCYILPPPIDTKLFRKMDDIERVEGKVVHTSGKLHQEGKGLFNLVNYVRYFPKYKYEFYTVINDYVRQMISGFEDKITLKARVPLEQLPAIYNSAEYAIHLPIMPEAAGRIMMEAYLCGCKLIMNDNVGLKSFDLPWKDYNAVKEIVELGPYKFWREVSKVL